MRLELYGQRTGEKSHSKKNCRPGVFIIQLSNGDFRMALNVLPLTGINYNLTKRQFNLSFDLLSKRGRSRYRSNMQVFSASKMLSFLRCVPA